MADFFTDAETGYRKLMETSSDAILSADGHFRIFFSNSSAEKMFGYTKEEFKRYRFWIFSRMI